MKPHLAPPRAAAPPLAATLLGAAPAAAVAPWRSRGSQSRRRQRGRFAGGEPVTLNFVNADIEAVTRAPWARSSTDSSSSIRASRADHAVQRAAHHPARGLPQLPRRAARPGLHGGRGRRSVQGRAEADAKLQSGTVAVGETSRRGRPDPHADLPLNHENANNLVPVLRPLISPNNTINANPATTRWSSPTTPTTCSASPRSSRRWTPRRPARSR